MIEIDMGSQFPLRTYIRPYRVLALIPLSLALIFLGGTIIYSIVASDPIMSNFILMITILIGIVCLIIGVHLFSGSLKYEITANESRLTTGGCIGNQQENEPLEAYRALISKESTSDKGRAEYYIILWHNKFIVKNINLYVGHDKGIFERRLAELETLLGLPVNPPGLEVVELPAHLTDAMLESQNQRILDER